MQSRRRKKSTSPDMPKINAEFSQGIQGIATIAFTLGDCFDAKATTLLTGKQNTFLRQFSELVKLAHKINLSSMMWDNISDNFIIQIRDVIQSSYKKAKKERLGPRQLRFRQVHR